MEHVKTFCPECGFGVKIDEHGCCGGCGATATGKGVDSLLKSEPPIEAIRAAREYLKVYVTNGGANDDHLRQIDEWLKQYVGE